MFSEAASRWPAMNGVAWTAVRRSSVSPTKNARKRYDGVYSLGLHRADLLDSLVRLVPSDRIRLGARLVDLDNHPDGVVAKLDSGEEVVGDILVGADGLRSTVRRLPVRRRGGAVHRLCRVARDDPRSGHAA